MGWALLIAELISENWGKEEYVVLESVALEKPVFILVKFEAESLLLEGGSGLIMDDKLDCNEEASFDVEWDAAE